MKTIDVKDIPNYLDAAPTEMATLFIGDTGIGKTQVIEQYAKDRGIFLKTIILSQLEASEALGIPLQTKRVFRGVEYPSTDFAVPSWVFELADHENSMLYLDEFLCAEPAVMNSMLNFLTSKNVHGIDLSHVKVVAATNIGNYTYEPDNNILSRFCMFYTVNNDYNKYLNNKYKGSKITIDNTYKDIEERDGVIFEVRSLKPRCQEMLYMLKDDTLLNDFYEGYTNMTYKPKFHSNAEISEIVGEFAKKNENSDNWYISPEDLDNIAGLLYLKVINSTRKNAVEWFTKFKNISYSQYELMRKVNELIRQAKANSY